MADNLGNMLNTIKNATLMKHEVVLVPYTLNNFLISKILYEEDFLDSISIISKKSVSLKKGQVQRFIKINFRYESQSTKPFIKNIVRLSKPSLQVYTNYKNIPQVLNGLGIIIMSTSKGIMTSREALKLGIGGELLFSIW
ncbi:30S ribosomal protein S8 (plastid) [Lotharella oceanica]|uniref:30S ribosomal protein S8 n=1 Tax=Lotharella oceanica TaxID=641309 RepID=A0A059SNV5_9EUKA|nr:30S ribosomal protein S8 [Lotharella oceanica]